jgi:2-C-methyl-D-erythritol 4-phosphate cytidylyltransferase
MSGVAAGRVAAIIPAAGLGVRFGAEQPKAFFELAGLSLLTRSALVLAAQVEVIIVAVPAEFVAIAAQELDSVDAEVHVVVGGATRQDSVAAAMLVVPQDVEFVLVHDAARPLVPVSVISDVIKELAGGSQAVIPVLPVVDTIKRVDNNGDVVETVDRNSLRRVQTPQGFTKALLTEAFADPTHVATDEAGLVESLGVTIRTVAGSERAFKITTPDDVALALSLLGEA